MPRPALKAATTLGVELSILVDFLAVDPDLHDQIDTEDIKNGLLPLPCGQSHPEPDVFTTFAARRVGREANAGPLFRRILQHPLGNTFGGKRRVAPAVFPTLSYRLRCTVGQRGHKENQEQHT